jgi:hypothetical protein
MHDSGHEIEYDFHAQNGLASRIHGNVDREMNSGRLADGRVNCNHLRTGGACQRNHQDHHSDPKQSLGRKLSRNRLHGLPPHILNGGAPVDAIAIYAQVLRIPAV